MDTITLPKQINTKIKIASKTLGVSRDVFTLNAVLFYLQSFKNKIDLKNEFHNWDALSDEAFLKMNL